MLRKLQNILYVRYSCNFALDVELQFSSWKVNVGLFKKFVKVFEMKFSYTVEYI